MSEQTMELAATPAPIEPERDRGLLLIGLFKLSKCIFFFFVGLSVRHLLHADLGYEAMRLAQILHFDVEGRVVTVLIEKVDLIEPRRLRQIGIFSFGYSALSLIEGYGLMTAKVWAEYLTLTLTCLALPWELYELVLDPSWGRLALLVINLLVLGYLIWMLKAKKASKP